MRLNLKILFLFVFAISIKAKSQTLYLNIKTDSIKVEKDKDSLTYLKKHTNVKSINEEVDKIADSLIKKGYFELTVSKLEKVNDTLFESIFNLGKKQDKLRIYFSEEIRKRTSIIDERIEVPVENFESIVNGIQVQLTNKGLVFDKIQLTNIRREEGFLTGTLIVLNKGKRTIDNIVVKGYDDFPFPFIKYTSKLKKGSPLDLNLITTASKSLGNLRFIDQLKPPEVLFEKDSSTVFLYFEKAKSNYFDGFVGFSNDDEESSIKLNGYIDLRLVNNLDRGEKLNILWKNDGNEQTRFRALIDLPFIFKSPLGIETSLDIFRKDSTFLNTEIKFKLNYQLSPRGRVNLGVTQYESNDLLDNSLLSVDDLAATKISAGYSYRVPNTDDALFLDKANLFLETNFGNRKSSLDNETQYSLELRANYLWKINLRNRIYVNNSTAFLNSNNYFDNEKYRLGGINSIRGFNENSLESTFFTYLNTEYRFLLSGNTYINSIFDLGYLQDDLLKTKNNLLGFGVGLGINSNAGLFKLNYALGKSNDSKVKFSDAKVHISFSSIF